MVTELAKTIIGLVIGVTAGGFNAFPSGQNSTFVVLNVPFTSETPQGSWQRPWNNACEEASITMVEAWYQETKELSPIDARNRMQQLFAWEDRHFGGNANTDAQQTQELIHATTLFTARIVRNPTLENIKNELRAGRPVISLHYGYTLHNPLHRWARNGSYYHMMVITGFDDETQEFIINDTALAEGLDYRYSYVTILTSLHDYDGLHKKADGPPTVLFTAPNPSSINE